MDYTEKLRNKRMRIENGIVEKYKIFPWGIDVSSRGEESKIKDFKTLFNSGERNCRIALWNGLTRYMSVSDIDKEKFTDEEYDFILQRLRAAENAVPVYLNRNVDIRSERLILKPATEQKMLSIYRRHLKEDGDFTLYTGLKLTGKNLKMFYLNRPYCFAICEAESGKMVGMVGLHHYDEERRMAEPEWYIFKPYRRKGYGREAVTALARQAFDGKLFELREKLMMDTFTEHYAVIDLIRADIRLSNTASQRLAESCVFKKSYIDRRHFIVEGQGPEDGVIMELEPDDLMC